MKCPYRVSTSKHISRYGNGVTEIIEQTDFEGCYGDSCPLYLEEENSCIRVETEKGDCI